MLSALLPHHADTIRNLVAEFEKDPGVLALLLGGSLAHGCARPDSDVDVAIVVDAADFARRRDGGKLHYNNRALCTYGGYIDGKYMDVAFLRLVAERGSDPARYAFQDARVLVSRIPELESLLAAIVRFPVAQKRERLDRFGAQLLAWCWYYSEALRQENPYLVHLAIQKVVLFGCRIVLNENELLYPYHKWLLRVTALAPRRPASLEADLAALLAPGEVPWERVDAFCRGVLAWVGTDFAAADAIWPTRFMKDSELRWMNEEPAIDDL